MGGGHGGKGRCFDGVKILSKGVSGCVGVCSEWDRVGKQSENGR